jgi:type II secretory pathway pseudopilin PulG
MTQNFGRQPDYRGISLLETIFALGIFTLITIGASWFFSSTIRANKVVWAELSGHSDSRRVLARMVEDARRTELSSTGAYPIATATTNTLIFYANIDTDALKERIRYSLVTTTIQRGVVKPTGNPLQYVTSTEQVVTLARNIVNSTQGIPLFSYFDQSYTGVEAPLASPVSSTQIHMIKMQLEVEDDPIASPAPFYAQTTVQLRNLKTN